MCKPHHPTLLTHDTLTILGQYMDGHCTPLSEYPEIPRYSDHPGTVHGWAQAHCTLLSAYPQILRPSQDSTWMGTCTVHLPVRVSRDPKIPLPSREGTCPYLRHLSEIAGGSCHTSTMKQNYCWLLLLACLYHCHFLYISIQYILTLQLPIPMLLPTQLLSLVQ